MNRFKRIPLSFLDLLFILLLGFTVLFLISFLLITTEKSKVNVFSKAEYVITITWPSDNPDDIDVWMEDPLGVVASFRRKDCGLMHIDRDDRGLHGDILIGGDGSEIYFPHNQEILSLRGFLVGEWVLNLHAYRKESVGPVVVEVKVDRINPFVQTIFYKQVVLTTTWEEKTVGRFRMDLDGSMEYAGNMEKPLVDLVQ